MLGRILSRALNSTNKSARESLRRYEFDGSLEKLEERNLLTVSFQFNPAAGTPQAMIDGFEEAAGLWQHFLEDDVTVFVDISAAALGPGIIGSTSNVTQNFNYISVRAGLINDANSADDFLAIANLPAGPTFSAYINYTSDNPNGAGSATPYVDNDGGMNNSQIRIARANAKALGLIAANDPTTDGAITFSTNFTFDYDRSDGITAGQTDFVAVAAHEIGHLLGFTSGVGVLDNNDGQGGRPGPFNDDQFNFVSPLDLYRNSGASVSAGADIDWAADTRTKNFSLDGGTTVLGTFATGVNNGDGRQPSHWKDNLALGLMDPTLSSAELGVIRPLDLTAFDVIGWDLNSATLVSEPVINGTSGDDDFVVSLNPSDLSQIQVELDGVVIATYGVGDITSLTINGLGNNDHLTVDSTNGLITIVDGIRFDGGTGFDTLRMTGGSYSTESLVIGNTNGSGTDTIVGTGGSQLVQFENLEPFATNVVANNLILNGGTIGSLLNTANQINYTTSNIFFGTWGMVTVDAFEPIHFTNKTNLVIDAEAGADHVTLNNPLTPTALTSIRVDGDTPNNGDVLEINGVTGTNDDIFYTPTAAGAGTVTNLTTPSINFVNIEDLRLVGQAADNDGVRVVSTVGNDDYVWTAGATNDRGLVTGETGTFAITPATYSQINAYVVVASQPLGGTDTVTLNGTDADDTFNVTDRLFAPLASNFPSVVVNGGAPIFYNIGTNLIRLRGLSGNDTFDLNLSLGNAHSYLIEGGDSDPTSDTLNLFGGAGLTETVLVEPGTVANHQDISGLTSPITSTGVELITFSGENNDDTLIVELEDGFKTATLSDGPDGNGPAYDQLTSTVLPTIRYRDIANFEVDNDDLGEITIITDDLNEASNQILVDGDGDETLIIVGNDPQNDDFTLSNDGSGNVQIVDNREGVTINTTGIEGTNDRLVVRTGGQDDLLTVDVNGTDLLDLQIEYDGGPGNDLLVVTGNPSVVISNVTYTPGASPDAGKLEYNSTGNNMFIEFLGLEPVIDTTVAANLTVNGTNADNAITYTGDPADATRGQVAVDGFEVINFNNKVNLNLNALGGSDIVTINNPQVPTGLMNINVDGGPGTVDQLHVIGTPNADTFTLTAGNLAFNTLNVGYASVDSLFVAGRADDDVFNVEATDVSTRLAGNSGMDTFNVGNGGNVDAILNTLTIDGGGQANTLNVNDFTAATGNNVGVTRSSITGLAPATIRFAATGGSFSITLDGSNNADDQFVVYSLLLNDDITIDGNGGNDRMVVKPGVLGDANLNGGLGNDLFRVEFVGGGTRTVNVDGGPGNDNLAVFGTNDADTFGINTNLFVTNGGEQINFGDIEALQVHGLAEDDVFNVFATDIPVVLRGYGGNDTFNITTAYPAGDLNSILGPITVIGNAGANALNVSDLTGGFNNNVVVTATQISGFAPANINYVSTGGTFAITMVGSNFGDNFDIQSLNAFNTLTIFGNDGNDNFTVRSGALGDITLWGNDDDDNFVVNVVGSGDRRVTLNGGIGVNNAVVIGTTGRDVFQLRDGYIGRANERVFYSLIDLLTVNARAGNDAIHVNAGAPTTVVEAGTGHDYVAVHNTAGINRLVVNAGGGDDNVLVKRTSADTRINAQLGDDNVNIGSTQGVNFGDLNDISGRVTTHGGLGQDRLYINDRKAVGLYDYDVTPNWVVNSTQGIARPEFAGVNYTGGYQLLRLDGTDQRNVFYVQPSFTTRYFIDGNLPSRNQVDSASEGDFLHLITVDGDGHRLTLTDRDTGTGRWTFTNGFERVNFTEIEQFNHVERLAVGSDVHGPNMVKVYDAESRIHLFDLHPYDDPHFAGGIRVATGDINGDGIPDIVTTPGHGIVTTVKVFDGWDGSELNSFVAYGDNFRDGAFVAVGNVTGNTANDIVTAADRGTGNSEVRVFRNSNHGQTFANAWGYLPYGSNASDGASVATGDVNQDGYDDIITAPLHGKVQVAVVAGKAGTQNITELARFRAFNNDFRGGAYVSAGNYLGNGAADVIVGSGVNTTNDDTLSSAVWVYDGSTLVNDPLAYIAPDFAFNAYVGSGEHARDSVRTVTKDHDLDGVVDELFAGQGTSGQTNEIRVFEPLSGAITDTIFNNYNGVFLG